MKDTKKGWFIYILVNPIKMDDFGTPIFGNLYIYIHIYIYICMYVIYVYNIYIYIYLQY